MKDNNGNGMGMANLNPMMLQLLQGGGLTTPSQDREFTTNNSNLTLWWNKRKSENLAKIEESRLLAVSARTKAIREIVNLMGDLALAGERFYQERYKMDHERKMMDLAEKMQEVQITKAEREIMLMEVKVQTGMEELKLLQLENQLKSLQIQKRINDNDF